MSQSFTVHLIWTFSIWRSRKTKNKKPTNQEFILAFSCRSSPVLRHGWRCSIWQRNEMSAGGCSISCFPPLNKWCLSGALVSPGWEGGATEENKRLLAQLPCSSVSTDLKGGLIIYFSVVSCGKMNPLEVYVEPLQNTDPESLACSFHLWRWPCPQIRGDLCTNAPWTNIDFQKTLVLPWKQDWIFFCLVHFMKYYVYISMNIIFFTRPYLRR